MYLLKVRKSVDKLFRKMTRRNPKQLEIIQKKIEEIRNNPHHYKNLRASLQHLKEVHIDKSFVLTFSVDEAKKIVVVEGYDHHDDIFPR